MRGRHKAKKKASNSSSSQHNVNDVKQERNGKVDVEKEAGSSGNGSQSLNKRNTDVREESSMASGRWHLLAVSYWPSINWRIVFCFVQGRFRFDRSIL